MFRLGSLLVFASALAFGQGTTATISGTVTDSSGRKQIFDANTSGSYLASNDPRIIVGLGSASVQKIEVNWPSGAVQVLSTPQLDRYVVITEANTR